MRVALVARELYPFVGGGIAPIVAAAARELSRIAEVVLVTSGAHAEQYARLRRDGDERLPPPEVRLVFVEEPGEAFGAYHSYMHCWSARVDRALREAYPGEPPDLIEFCDYLGEGFVTVQARRTGDPWLARTRVCVRLHTTAYMCAVLDGQLPHDFATTAVFEAESYALEHADNLLWSGGDVLETYRRLYGADRLAPAQRIPDAFFAESDPSPSLKAVPEEEEPLRLLYLGRLERRKGVQNLIRAMTRLERDDVRLTVLGEDTDTAPLGRSMREQLLLMAADDPRIAFHEGVPRDQVSEVIAQHDVMVIPSLWECWPNVGREALLHNRPLLATPVGGLCEMAEPGRSGWLTRDRSSEALADAIDRLAEEPQLVRDVVAAGGPRSKYEELTDADALRSRYRALLAEGPPPRPAPPAAGRSRPLVSVVIPYHELDAHLDETVESVLAQSHRPLEVLVVNDGSRRKADRIVLDRVGALESVTVLTQPNSGLGSARNFGIAQSRGRYVLPLDADDLIVPDYVARCVAALEAVPELAYVTGWVEYMDPRGKTVSDDDGGYVPFGNWSSLIETNNVGGTCVALLRRELFEGPLAYSTDLTSYEDWLLYLQMHRLGRFGDVIPERLIRYRVRDDSMMRTVGEPRLARLQGELAALARERELVWSPSDYSSARRVD